MSRVIFVMNGRNRNLLGKRQRGDLGHESLADRATDCRRVGRENGLDIRFRQGNLEYEIIDRIDGG